MMPIEEPDSELSANVCRAIKSRKLGRTFKKKHSLWMTFRWRNVKNMQNQTKIFILSFSKTCSQKSQPNVECVQLVNVISVRMITSKIIYHGDRSTFLVKNDIYNSYSKTASFPPFPNGIAFFRSFSSWVKAEVRTSPENPEEASLFHGWVQTTKLKILWTNKSAHLCWAKLETN